MERRNITSEDEAPALTLDLEGLLGAGRVFDVAGDASRQAALIEANCNKVGEVPPPPA